jgi:hypothetical protein
MVSVAMAARASAAASDHRFSANTALEITKKSPNSTMCA